MGKTLRDCMAELMPLLEEAETAALREAIGVKGKDRELLLDQRNQVAWMRGCAQNIINPPRAEHLMAQSVGMAQSAAMGPLSAEYRSR